MVRRERYENGILAGGRDGSCAGNPRDGGGFWGQGFVERLVPFVRDGGPSFTADPPRFLQHLGLYAYRRDFLLELSQMPPAPLEHLEKLEQLRVLAAGHAIAVGVVRHASIGVDTREDYERFVSAWRQRRVRKAA